MKKFLALCLALCMAFVLVGCGGSGDTSKTPVNDDVQEENGGQSNEAGNETNNDDVKLEIEQLGGGDLKVTEDDMAFTYNGKSVAYPYDVAGMEAAGLPIDASSKEIKLASGDYFVLNVYLDENEDYILNPDLYNESEEEASIMDAKATSIRYTTYLSEPVDQGITMMGVKLGMTRAEVRALLGDPKFDEGTEYQYGLKTDDVWTEGSLNVSFVSDADDALVYDIYLGLYGF